MCRSPPPEPFYPPGTRHHRTLRPLCSEPRRAHTTKFMVHLQVHLVQEATLGSVIFKQFYPEKGYTIHSQTRCLCRNHLFTFAGRIHAVDDGSGSQPSFSTTLNKSFLGLPLLTPLP